MRWKQNRDEIIKLLKAQPFERFQIEFENGQNVLVEHPENVAYDPPGNGKRNLSRLHIMSRDVTVRTTFHAVTAVLQKEKR